MLIHPGRGYVAPAPFDIGFVYLQVKTDSYKTILNLVEQMIIINSRYIILKTPVCNPLNGTVTAD